MRTLVRQYLDNEISRRGFLGQLSALGVSVASAQALLASLTVAEAADSPEEGASSSRIAQGNGSDLLFDSLLEADVKYIFHGCGGGINRFFDSIVTRPKIQNFLATNEGQCIAMAEGYHIASGGEIGVAIIPRPGLMNAGGNIHNAMVNRSSLIVLCARENEASSHRRGNIELVDWQEIMDPLMKWSYKMRRIERVPEFTRRAVKVARTQPGGPVFLQMTEDLYDTQGEAEIIPQAKFQVPGRIKARPERIERAARMLLEAENPLLTVGLEVTKAKAQAELIELAELLAIPVMQGLSAFADFPNQHPLSLGWYTRFSGYMRRADLMMLIGSQMPDAGHYVLTGPPPDNARIVHISVEPEMLALSHPTELSIVSDAKEAITDLIEAVKSLATKQRLKKIREERYGRVTKLIADDLARKKKRASRAWDSTPISYPRLTTELNDLLDDDAIIASESLYDVSPWFDLGHNKKMAIGPQPGEVLGWATGIALGAKLAQPNRQVVAVSGDGAFMFQNAMWSLARYDAPIMVVVYNNRAYNMNRTFNWLKGGAQAEMKKDLLTYLGDPDMNFATYAKAHGVDGETVSSTADIRPAIKRGIRAMQDGRPYLLDVRAERWGGVGEETWHPDISIAGMRDRKV
jgi:thiamine pyrophosphate-dependent acetolactate synthase large subunit-like protein